MVKLIRHFGEREGEPWYEVRAAVRTADPLVATIMVQVTARLQLATHLATGVLRFRSLHDLYNRPFTRAGRTNLRIDLMKEIGLLMDLCAAAAKPRLRWRDEQGAAERVATFRDLASFLPSAEVLDRERELVAFQRRLTRAVEWRRAYDTSAQASRSATSRSM